MPQIVTKITELPKSWESFKAKWWVNGYPTGVSEREGYILEYMDNNSDLSEEEKMNLLKIARCENKDHNPKVVASVTVKVCKKEGRSKNRVVELTKKNGLNVQDYCENYGEKEIANIRTIGMFQILESNFKNYKCEGDIFNAETQIQCSINIYKQSGLNAWTCGKSVV
jgi:hypothetical protein